MCEQPTFSASGVATDLQLDGKFHTHACTCSGLIDVIQAKTHAFISVATFLFQDIADLTTTAIGRENILLFCCICLTHCISVSNWQLNTHFIVVPCDFLSLQDNQRSGSTAFLLAAKSGNVELCKLLLDHGADIGATNSVRPFSVLYIGSK